jgi:hypothetical protein
MNDIRKEAERLVQLGYKVFPCRPGQKIPATTHGYKDATTLADQIDAWFGENESYNLAVATDGLIVIDPDTLPDGSANPWLTAERKDMLATGAVTITPRGGRHYWFRQPGGMDVRNSAGVIADRVDIRANGGYVVVPPSRLPNGAYRYDLHLMKPPDKLPLPPAWLLDAIRKPKANSETNGKADTCPNAIAAGKRNATLASLAGRLRKQGASQSEIEAFLLARNEEQCQPPLPREEVIKIAASVGRYERGDDYKPVPPEVHIVCISDIERQQLKWLWPDRIPLGKLTLLCGDPGLGNRTLPSTRRPAHPRAASGPTARLSRLLAQ